MHYVDRGEGPAVVFLHSLGHDHSVFDSTLAHIDIPHRAIRYDLRGHGGSSLGSATPCLDTLAADLRELVAHLQLTQAHFVGQSIGGMILLHAACHGLLRGTLCLLDTIAWTDEEWNERYRQRAAKVRADGVAAVADSIADISIGSVTPDRASLVDRYAKRLAANDSEAYAWACESMLDFDLRPKLAHVRLPVLAAAGEQDPVTPLDRAEAIAKMVEHGSFRAIPRSGHLPALENPVFTADLITHWMTGELDGALDAGGPVGEESVGSEPAGQSGPQ
jgi:pimeloyl-ACP methyl ester carboxylesterase